MCGIVGYISGRQHAGSGSTEWFHQAVASLTHRGPDSHGEWQSGSGHVQLGQRRLAVIDLSEGGRQPMHRGTLSIVFNGEIYNYRLLRSELANLGHSFESDSDTEVLLAAIQQWGLQQACRRADGMFAFAVFDNATNRLTLGRDRFGEKPLYVMANSQGIGFASELRALRHMPGFSSEINPAAFAQYAATGAVAHTHAIHSGCAKIAAGSIVDLDCAAPPTHADALPRVTWWSPIESALAARKQPFVGSLQEAADTLDTLLQQSTASRTIADVPVGAFLSGGIDSSAVVASMCASGADVRTFTIGSDVGAFDEAADAKAIARHLGTSHTELIVTSADALNVVPRLADLYDEPFADSSQVPTFLVSQLARQHVTVALSGDAGDELFGGYNRYTEAAYQWGRLERLPFAARQIASRAATTIPPRWYDSVGVGLDRAHITNRFARNFGDGVHKRARAVGANDAAELYKRLTQVWDPDIATYPARRAPHSNAKVLWPEGLHVAENMMLLDTVGYLHDDILTKVDRAAMANSLETRVPFLNPALFDFAWSLPLHYRAAPGRGKVVLREVLGRRVPAQLFERPKTGFGVPIGEWLRGPLSEWASDLLSPARLTRSGWFDAGVVATHWAEHRSGRRNHQHQLWTVLMFEAWRDTWTP
jgi:asparagine synthase (glutamine-hydrolysing)